jgi:hypothetical protein
LLSASYNDVPMMKRTIMSLSQHATSFGVTALFAADFVLSWLIWVLKGVAPSACLTSPWPVGGAKHVHTPRLLHCTCALPESFFCEAETISQMGYFNYNWPTFK